MSSPNLHSSIKLAEGKLVDRIKGCTQKDWIKACERLGLCVLPNAGRGSHCAVYKDNTCPPEDSSCCVVTIPQNVYPNFQRDLVKKVVAYGLASGKYTEGDVWKALGVKK
ncbi:MAG: hypothetical protein UX71_C0002G0139 [Parcubacteria group bacterium GW2011_GWA1_47_10]|nr:MAG: hypothetical protein UX71_C0002G0139 [Parcubacteria group bacterium GW2011_GWA1_47_10]